MQDAAQIPRFLQPPSGGSSLWEEGPDVSKMCVQVERKPAPRETGMVPAPPPPAMSLLSEDPLCTPGFLLFSLDKSSHLWHSSLCEECSLEVWGLESTVFLTAPVEKQVLILTASVPSASRAEMKAVEHSFGEQWGHI